MRLAQPVACQDGPQRRRVVGVTTRDPETAVTDRSSGWTSRRAALLAGPAEAIVLIGGILLAAYVVSPAPSFRWIGGDFSQFGMLRHYSIALGGLLGLVFLWPVWAETTNRIQRVGIGLFGIGWLITAGANALATAGIRAGGWAILGLILLFPLALFVYGGGDFRAGHRQRGSASLLLGSLYLGMVIVFLGVVSGYELVYYVSAFVVVSVWAILMFLALRE